MRVIITGGTGLIGRSLVECLSRHSGYKIIVLSRQPQQASRLFQPHTVQVVAWDACTDQGWGDLISADCAIVNLAGASPAHWRWTQAYRARILESRLQAGQAIMQAIEHHGPPAVLIQASASGYYGDRGQELLPETSSPGHGFRARVCEQWEASTAGVPTRRCIIRTGLVLDTHEGAFPPLLLFARLIGRQIGNGQQWLPWIHKEDVARAIQFLIEQPALSGPFNLCAPEAASNKELLHAVRQILRRYPLFPLPAWLLQLLLGELSTVILDSQHMLPQRLLAANFSFNYPHLDAALRHLLRKGVPI